MTKTARFALCVATLALTSSTGHGEPRLILDERAYWRYCLYGGPARISYQAMKEDAAKVFKERDLERRKQQVLRKLKQEGRTTDDWRKELYYPTGYLNLRLLNEVDSTPPSGDWMKPDFDDRDWSWNRKPFKMGKDFYLDGFVDHFFQIKTTYFRTTFEVPDPNKAGDLRLELVYRGGIRAFLNGLEVGRGHLPAGPLAPDVPAERYPSDAYYARKGEFPPGSKEGRGASWVVNGENFLVPDIGVFARSPDRFEDARKSDKIKGDYRRARALGYGGRSYITRAAWDRIVKTRNRRLEVRIPRAKLRKGTNLLALEVRSSEMHPITLRWGIPWEGSCTWKHGWLLRVALRGGGETIPQAMTRPAGVQAWSVDVHHRLYSPEFHPPGSLPEKVHIVGARNGTYSAQVAVGTDRDLRGLRATVGGFRGPGGKTLPASIARVTYPLGRPEWELKCAGEGKGFAGDCRPGFTRGNATVILDRFSPIKDIIRPPDGDEAARQQRATQESELKRIKFFDHLTDAPPAPVPADSCRPVWISVTVPEDAAPGRYAAALKIQADGMDPVTLPVELDVADWRLPDSKDFQPIMALEQSPYAVARRYKVPLWSEEHFRLLEKSLRLLGRVGNDFLAIPVVTRTEFGNSDDSPIVVTRRRDGKLSLDFTIADRYLDLAIKHWGAPRCVCFVVDHCGVTPYDQTLYVKDEASGKRELLQIGRKAPAQQRRAVWRALATAIYDHMRSRGLEKLMHWGMHGDGVNDPTLPRLLREFAPDVTWARFSHQYRPDQTYTFCANVRGGHNLAATSRKGWKALTGAVNLWLPRHWNSIAVAEGKSAPPAYRLGIERTLVAGAPGLARMGADYWDGAWLRDSPLRPYTGMPISSVFWPGTDGAESSARFEMLCEGLQEVEARLFLEQAMEKLDDPKLRQQVTALLDKRIHDTLFALVFAPHVKIEEYSSGWQVRSRALYQAAAKVGRLIGVDFAANRLRVSVPAGGGKTVKVNLRNWTSRPRAWKVASVHDWIRPRRAAGSLKTSAEALQIVIDAAALEPGEPATGTLTLTDVQTGRAEPLEITADVSRAFRLTGVEQVVNVSCGSQEQTSFTLLNSGAAELDWKIEASEPWLRCRPAGGKLPSGRQAIVGVSAGPPDVRRALHQVSLLVTEAGGAEENLRLKVHVLPMRRARSARPPGRTVPMQEVPKELAKSCILGGRPRDLRQGIPFYKPQPNQPLAIGRKSAKDWRSSLKQYKKGLSVPPGSEIVYNIEGKGFSAFSAEVGWSNQSGLGHEPREIPRVHFEIYVDGRLADHSGFMDLTDPPRILAAEGLTDAKEVRLVTRLHNDRLNDRNVRVSGVWGEPAFHHAK